ncbi:hypothetical protein SH580_17610 [Coraliomargarita algicola]|uniref:Uncharacterized protein n=1 Tax=Coraliomargarita algicola TaxID=3092156 RepID=A0ABZ0RJZ8_9BACT|nr:hypothetical protein [Coraliomargarita sp. J2-16]WPJ95242.1 hypothetical protein SH580_17610 [Coraliomargarita sp. J2-16]
MAQIETLPPALAETLSRFPSPGERNNWFFEVAVRARQVASEKRVREVLHQVVAHQGWSDRDFSKEIDRAVRRAYDSDSPARKTGARLAKAAGALSVQKYPPWPKLDESLRATILITPPIFDPGETLDWTTADIVDALYQSDDLLCLAKDNTSAVTAPRNRWRGRESQYQFLVANPMRFLMGRTQEGKPSSRCHGNATRSRIFQVVEFDQGTREEQAAILSALNSEQTPLVLVVWSGSKSLHGWFDVRKLSEAEKCEFFAQACRYGADRTLWDQSKLVRMPGGTRQSNGQQQSILYFCP